MATNNTSILLIDTCSAADFGLLWPKTSGSWRPGHVDSVRHCDACHRNVYLCRSDDNLTLDESLGYGVAISQQRLEDHRRPVPHATQSTTDAVSSPVAAEKGRLSVSTEDSERLARYNGGAAREQQARQRTE